MTTTAPSRVAAVLLLRADGAALLQLRDDRPGLHHAGLWVPPGGHCEAGESWEACAGREFLEESGYRCSQLRWLELLSADGEGGPRPNETVAFFWDRYDGVQHTQCFEGQALRFVLRQEAHALPMPTYLPRLWDQALSAMRERDEVR